jgi:hypothetical protein
MRAARLRSLFRSRSRSNSSIESINTRCEPQRVRIVRSRPARIR